MHNFFTELKNNLKMERNTRPVENPDRFVAGESRTSKILTGLKNTFLRPDLGYIKRDKFELSPDVQIEHREDCSNPEVKVFPIFNIVALPQMAGPISEYARRDMQLAQCGTCEAEQVLKGGE